MKIRLDSYALMPVRAHREDAGLDIKSPVDVKIRRFGSAVIKTGVHVQLPEGTVGFLMSKSGLNIFHGITSTGTIDEGYTGEIVVRLDNHSRKKYVIRKGDKITQLVILPVVRPEIEVVDELDAGSERGDNGFGSSGR